MMQVLILALLFTQGLALAEHNEVQKVTVESKLKDDEAAGDHLHKLERRAIPSSMVLDERLNFVRFCTVQTKCMHGTSWRRKHGCTGCWYTHEISEWNTHKVTLL